MIQNKADDEKCASQDAGSAYEKLVICLQFDIFHKQFRKSISILCSEANAVQKI